MANAKLLCRFFDYDFAKLREAGEEEIASVEGIGPIIAASVAGYFADAANASAVDELLAELTIERPQANQQAKTFIGKTFVITGSVEHFANRSELKSYIEERGGKVTGSVTKKTDYLINNDTTSASSKNKKAQELGIPVISEAEFLELEVLCKKKRTGEKLCQLKYRVTCLQEFWSGKIYSSWMRTVRYIRISVKSSQFWNLMPLKEDTELQLPVLSLIRRFRSTSHL